VINAINAANDEVCYPGQQTIHLGGGDYVFDEVGTIFFEAALPEISSDIVINGANGARLIRDISSPLMRIIFVTPTGRLTLNSVAVELGSNGGEGGNIYNEGYLELNNVTIKNGQGNSGGGIFTTSDVVMQNSIIEQNTSTVGGGMYVRAGTTRIANSSFIDNQTSGDGAGLFVSGGGVSIVNTTFSGNIAPGVGAIYSEGTLSLSFVTVAFNTSSGGFSGGISIQGGTTDIRNSIVSNNSGGNCLGSYNSLAGNFSQDDTCGGFAIVVIGLESSLNYDSGLPVHRLVPGSGVIDMLSDCLAVNGSTISSDERGRARPLDGDDSTTNECDPGAVEYDFSIDNP